MSPRASLYGPGMPCTTMELGDAQIDPGKPRYPLKAGSPPCERMKRSAARSSSSVVTPGRALPRSIVRQRASTRPASAIFSISSGVLRRITGQAYSRPSLQLLLHSQRRHRGPDVVVHLGWWPRSVEAPEDALLLVALLERLWPLVVDGQAPSDHP